MAFPSDLLFYATYNSSTTADYIKTGNPVPIVTGPVTIDTSIKNCGAGSVKFPAGSPGSRLHYSGGVAGMTNVGCVRFWMYLGTTVFLGSLFVSRPSTNRIQIFRSAGDSIVAHVFAAGSQVFSFSVPNVARNTWIHCELNFDISGGNSRLFLDGVEKGYSSNTGSRSASSNFRLAQSTFGEDLAYLDDLQIFNTVQHTANFTPACGLPPSGVAFPISQGTFGGAFGGANISGVTGGTGGASPGLGGRGQGGGGLMQTLYTNELVAERRRVFFKLVDETDGQTVETGEAGGQPEISINGADYINTDGVLIAVDSAVNGTYYVELSTGEVDNSGSILVRYKSANTAEFEDVLVLVKSPGVNDNDDIKSLIIKVQQKINWMEHLLQKGEATAILQQEISIT